MLKFFFRRQKLDTKDVPYNEQRDPYLEALIRELILKQKEESVKLVEQLKQKEPK